MPSVDFDREYNQQEEYPFRNLDKYVQAVRANAGWRRRAKAAPLRYILPVDATDYPNGWQISPQRDYLLPVPETMLTAPGGTWVQNPGW